MRMIACNSIKWEKICSIKFEAQFDVGMNFCFGNRRLLSFAFTFLFN